MVQLYCVAEECYWEYGDEKHRKQRHADWNDIVIVESQMAVVCAFFSRHFVNDDCFTVSLLLGFI